MRGSAGDEVAAMRGGHAISHVDKIASILMELMMAFVHHRRGACRAPLIAVSERPSVSMRGGGDRGQYAPLAQQSPTDALPPATSAHDVNIRSLKALMYDSEPSQPTRRT
tara:strand:- start:5943 stop:6272 length:330 start_codon:yes stop_codon:yes gene_type:complete